MKRILSIIFLTIFGFVTNVWADNVSIENAKFLPGSTKTVAVSLSNSATDYAAFQMDVYLPKGLSIDKSNTSLTDRAEAGGSITIGKQKSGAFRLVYSSLSLTPITGTSGALVNLCLKASSDFAGGTVSVKNITFGTTDSKTVKLDDVSFEMSKAIPVVVTGNTIKMKYGDVVPELTYLLSDNNITGTPVLTCEATSTSPVGSYPIKVSQGTLDADYVEYVDGTLIIEKAPLTISAGIYTKKQSDAMPAFKATYTGFKNGETEAVLTKQPIFYADANENSEPGKYPVYVSGAEAQNYELTYVPGMLVVEAKKTQKIIWNQEIKAKVGSTIKMEGTATSGLPVRYSSYRPNWLSAFIIPEINGDEITFPQSGNCIIIAIQDGNEEYEMAADTIQVNVLDDDENLMYIDGIYYKYTDASRSALKVVKGYKPYMGKVEIPATANGLPVVNMDDFSLYASNFLTEVVIGHNVTDCGAQFAGACPNLRVITLPNNHVVRFDYYSYPFNCDSGIKEIHCRSQIPYKADETTFNGFVDYTTCILYVPTGTRQAYREAQEWCKFVNIIEEDVPSGIGNVQIVGDSLSWYTLHGIKLPAKPSAAGVYIHGGKKVIVK